MTGVTIFRCHRKLMRDDLNSKLAIDPAHLNRVTSINHLNAARNFSAHARRSMPPGITLDPASLDDWKKACDEFVGEIERALNEHLHTVLGVNPW